MKTQMNTQTAQAVIASDAVRGEMVNEATAFVARNTEALKAPRLRLLQRREVRRNRRLAH